MEILAIEIKRSGYARHLSAGVVLTGGGTLIPGTAELAQDVLGMDARIGSPLGLAGGMVDEVASPTFATSVGLVLYGLQTGEGASAVLASDEIAAGRRQRAGESLINKISNRMKGWFDEL